MYECSQLTFDSGSIGMTFVVIDDDDDNDDDYGDSK